MNIGVGINYKIQYDDDDRYILIIAKDNELIVGALTLRIPVEANESPEIIWLAVENNNNYRRRGIGTKLTDIALQEVLSSGYFGGLEVCPLLKSKESVVYWEAVGFRETPEPRVSALCPVFAKSID